MRIFDSQGENVLSAQLSVDGDLACTHAVFGGGAAELDLPKMNVSFESQKEGLLVHLGLAGTDKKADILVEYADVKALREIPGKGLVSFVLKAFR